MISLVKGDVTAVIDAASDAYNGARFDHMGIVVQLRKGPCSFCGAESQVVAGSSGGLGLANEFGLDAPIGYDEADEGGLFLKIGVGWLEKPDAGCFPRYSHMLPYEIKDLASYGFRKHGDALEFHFDSGVINGYGVVYEKAYEVKDYGIDVSFHLKNTGSKPIETNEYCHCFLSMNQMPVDGKYILKTSVENIDKEIAALVCGARKAYYASCETAQHLKEFSGWTLSHLNLPTSIAERVDFPIQRFAVWGTRAVLSPECFHKVKLMPGECDKWMRKYIFTNADSGAF
jgi:hypothetical protein